MLTLRIAVQAGSILRHSSSIKPLLTGNNKTDCIKFAMDDIEYTSRKDEYEFNNTYVLAHEDKKRF